MNLIKSDEFNAFRYKFLIVIYNIELKRYMQRREAKRRTRNKEKSKIKNIKNNDHVTQF